MTDIEVLFRIGAQYENWEFLLEEVGEVKIQGLNYEVYEFPGSLSTIKLFARCVGKVLLFFNADILERVEYYLDIEHYSIVRDKLMEIQPEHCTVWNLETSNGKLIVVNCRSTN